jgi:MRG-binding protein
MPPRKSAQVGLEMPVQPIIPAPEQSGHVSEEVQKSLARWTDEQEIALLKGIVRWKPVGLSLEHELTDNADHVDEAGMHKHFRVIAIHNFMVGQGVVNSDDQHTTIAGLWTKLGSLYNLPVLDEREDSILHGSSDENGSPGELYCPYDLPEQEYGAMKFDKRINLAGSKSPASFNSRRESTIADTDEPGSSPAPGRRGGRATRRGGRLSKLQQEGAGSSSRRTSKAASATEDEIMEDVGDGGGEDEQGSDEADEDDDDDGEAEESSKARNSTKGRGGGSNRRGFRGRGGTRTRGRRK